MNKRIICVVLSVLMLLFSVFSVSAAENGDETEPEEVIIREMTISTAEEFLEFAENCRLDTYSKNLEVTLQADIDLTGVDFQSVPIFSGTFDGDGHSITGVTLTAEGSVQGLFRYLTSTAIVKDLHIEGELTPGGSRNEIGGIAGQNAGTISGCSFSGVVSGGDSVGGIAGINAVTGVIEDCDITGTITGNHFVGGVAGENYGVIRNCENSAEINTTAQENTVELSEITLDTMTNSESANTVTDVGGIAGISSGVIRDCENRAGVGYQQMGYNIGGIAGTQSGYILNCENYGAVQGRKEVGGIAGQMEPVAQIEYSEDTLQILQGQLSTMSGLVNRASSNAQTNASQIAGQINLLQDQADTAQEAIDTLFPEIDIENPEFPDADTLLAAQNSLTSSISAMPGTLESIMRATQNTVTTLSSDLEAAAGQVNAMGATINGASETLGGSITDISDLDTDETLMGKVESCVNYGAVLADMNVGGIAGAIAVENDLDLLEDWETIGESSLNFSSELRAVILNCENMAEVTAKKQQAGGIAGWQSMGLMKNCENTGSVLAADADHVGGISGISNGFIRNCSAKCLISGDSYVGGIAGSASIATDCRSMVQIENGAEKVGEVLGYIEANETEEEDPILGNYYLSVADDRGAVDGISYAGMAEPLERSAFLALEELPELFSTVEVRFVFEDGTDKTIALSPGAALDDAKIPEVPEKDGCIGEWEGLSETDLSSIVFNMTFEAIYTSKDTVIQSEDVRGNGQPLLLAQGTFAEEAAVEAGAADAAPELSEDETLLEAWSVTLSGAEKVTGGRLQLPAEQDAEHLHIYLCTQDGTWMRTEFTVEGSYAVFDMTADTAEIALVQAEPDGMQWMILTGGAAAAVVLLVVAIVLCRKRRKKKSA